ncbi:MULTISPECIES: aldo/keto reductase [Sphingobacterium]|jgi:aryl-alcohol dehydrogenase-like predicted oxidoreductase|uniref:aldo/keto reductase n=1 Tax=Sphingobacterium TaxID=28453 RepID=UPI00258037F3|nr:MULTISPECIES: aldo/keto reductase [Sphingobacterium]MDF2849797.1 oxidoreductase [Sphingobacterium multivorum]
MLNKLILGTVQLGLPYGINNAHGQITLANSLTLLEEAFKSGITFLDTAEAYGNAHDIIGLFHRRNAATRFNILTKLPHEFTEQIDEKVERYLDQLEVDSLYGFSFHSFASYNRRIKEVSRQLRKLKEKGQINKIGVSVYTNEEAIKSIEDPLIDFIQIPYNLFDNCHLRNEVLEKATNSDKEIHTRSCFLQGLFFMSPENENPVAIALKEELSVINDIAERYNISIQDLALHYTFKNRMINSVLIGVDSWEQLLQNIVSLQRRVPKEALMEVERIKIKDIDLINPTLWNKLK